MNYQLQYNYCAIIIYLIILVSHLMRKRTKELHNEVFTYLVIVSMFGAIVNIFNTFGNMNENLMPHNILVLLDYFYFIALNLSPFIYSIYAVMLTKNSILSMSIKLKCMIFCPISVVGLLLIVNPFLNTIFQYNELGYSRGSCQIIMYIIDLYYGVFGVVYVLREKESTTRELKISLFLFFVIGCAMAMIQFINPELLLQHLGLSVCELIVLLNLQKPEEYIDSQTGAYNRSAFDRIFKLNIKSKEHMQILMVNIEDLNFLIQTVGVDVEKTLFNEMADYLNKVSDGDLYVIDTNSMIIMKSGSSEEIIDKIVGMINERFDEKWGSGENKLFINYKMMKVRVPEDVRDLDVLYFCNSNFVNMPSVQGKLVDIKNIDFNKAGRRIKVEKIINRAVSEDNFTMYYQPIYSFNEDKIVSAEALIRLIDPDEGFIPPDEFIPIAEQNGTIIQIGDMVFKKVFEFISKNDIRAMGINYIEINLSVIQCMQENLAERILELINKYDVDKNMINLEITETAAVDSPIILLKNMKALFDAGVSFSLDDFGTGYSNINALMSLPLDIIKFDKSLVDMASEHERGKGVIDSSVAMVKKMGLKIVAEGIEEKHQINMLKEMGVDFIQGYYFSKPLPEEDFIGYVNQRKCSG